MNVYFKSSIYLELTIVFKSFFGRYSNLSLNRCSHAFTQIVRGRLGEGEICKREGVEKYIFLHHFIPSLYLMHISNHQNLQLPVFNKTFGVTIEPEMAKIFKFKKLEKMTHCN